jgi:hypothetical protein
LLHALHFTHWGNVHAAVVQMPRQKRVQGAVDQRRFARTGLCGGIVDGVAVIDLLPQQI